MNGAERAGLERPGDRTAHEDEPGSRATGTDPRARVAGEAAHLAEDARRAREAGCSLTGLLAQSRHARVHGVRIAGGTAVLKCATAETMADSTGRTRFAREGRVGSRLRHPNLVETLAYGEGWILLADLRTAADAPAAGLERLGPGKSGARAVAHRLAPIADALAHLHARGLVHRDVKPDNIVIAPGERPVLIDLGIVAIAGGDRLDATETAGSPAWMAPEQIRGAPSCAAADAWSFAAVLGFLICGVAPFAGSADAVLARRREGRGPDAPFVERLDALSAPPLGELVWSGLSDDARARPPVAVFADRLRCG